MGWLRGAHRSVTLDLFTEGLVPGEGVCGSVTALPFASGTFDVVGAFDVVEHCANDHLAVSELARVVEPGGRVLLSVPAYPWAWSDHDVRAGHHRRYTRPQVVALVRGTGLTVVSATYAFAAVFPLFVGERACVGSVVVAPRGRGCGHRTGRRRLPRSPRPRTGSSWACRAWTDACSGEAICRSAPLVFVAAVKPEESG